MNDLNRTISAHFIHEQHGALYRHLISFAPRVGDELRFAGDRFFTVTRLVWIYDEPGAKFTRLNVGIKEAA